MGYIVAKPIARQQTGYVAPEFGLLPQADWAFNDPMTELEAFPLLREYLLQRALLWDGAGVAPNIAWEVAEVPGGTRDGIRRTFTLARSAIGRPLVLVNGRLADLVGYEGRRFTLASLAPVADDTLLVAYPYLAGVALPALVWEPGELLDGTKDGANKAFTVAHAPYGDRGLLLYQGTGQNPEHVTIAGVNVTLGDEFPAPEAGEKPRLAYLWASPGAPLKQWEVAEPLQGVIDGVNDVFTSSRPPYAGKAITELGGLLLDIDDVAIVGNATTLPFPPAPGDARPTQTYQF